MPINSLTMMHGTWLSRFGVLSMLVSLLSLVLLAGCNSTSRDAGEAIPLPELGNPDPQRPRGVVGVIRRAEIPLDQPTDDAWAIINEQAIPPLTRGAWRANGLRLGLLQRDQLDAYASAMPQPVYYGETLINQSDYDVSILTTPRLRGDLLFEIDLTRPPKPRHVEDIAGGNGSSLRLLAKIETDAEGRHVLVLTPQHHVPKAPGLLVRDPLEKERDGRIFDELTVRITLMPEEVAVVGLYWPWPEVEQLPGEEQTPSNGGPAREPEADDRAPAYDASDPAAPPPHLTGPATVLDDEDGGVTTAEDAEGSRAYASSRIAPPLATTFGSTLLTGTRIRQPVRTVLLISIEAPQDEAKDAEPAP